MSDTDDIVAISGLQTHYADIINRRRWDELAECFLPDAEIRIDTVTRDPIEVVGPVALGEFIGSAVERFAFFEFVILNARIVTAAGGDPDRGTARIFMCEIRRDIDTLAWSTAYGVYHDRYRRTPDGWRFERRDYQSLTRTDGDVFPFPHHIDIS